MKETITDCKIKQGKSKMKLWRNFVWDCEDSATRSRLEKHHANRDIMRKESFCQSSLPRDPFESHQFSDKVYCVESTGAFVNLHSSIGL
ncbi:hypothetical protein AAHE18_19G150600 [Arachis hypogaea]